MTRVLKLYNYIVIYINDEVIIKEDNCALLIYAYFFIKFENMIGAKAIQATLIVGVLIISYEARFLLVKVERGNERGLHDSMMKPLEKTRGNIAPKTCFKV